MMWMARIGECVREAMAERGLTRDKVAEAADGVSKETVDAVKNGLLSVSAKNVEKVVRALGLQVVADCVPAADEWQADYARQLQALQERAGDGRQMTKSSKEDATELLSLCRTFIETGQAGKAVQALYDWRARREAASDRQRRPLA
jgi:transcriptional regulator with XRE-family HTH domain